MFPLPRPANPPDVVNCSDHGPLNVLDATGGCFEQESAKSSKRLKQKMRRAGTTALYADADQHACRARREVRATIL